MPFGKCDRYAACPGSVASHVNVLPCLQRLGQDRHQPAHLRAESKLGSRHRGECRVGLPAHRDYDALDVVAVLIDPELLHTLPASGLEQRRRGDALEDHLSSSHGDIDGHLFRLAVGSDHGEALTGQHAPLVQQYLHGACREDARQRGSGKGKWQVG